MKIKCTRCNESGQIRGAMQKLVPCNCCNGLGFIEVSDPVICDVVKGKVQEPEVIAKEEKTSKLSEERREAIRKGLERSRLAKAQALKDNVV